MSAAILARINAALAARGLSPRAAGLAAGLSAGFIRDIARGKIAKPSVAAVQALAVPLHVPPEWLAFGIRGPDDPSPANDRLHIIGEVKAGTWLDTSPFDQPAHTPAPLRPDARFPAEAQFLLAARGHSMNRLFADGALLHCVDCAAARIEARHGDVVVVERRLAGDGPAETTAKRLWRRKGKLVLAAESHEEGFRDFTIDPAEEDGHLAIRAVVLRAIGELWRDPETGG